MSIAPCARRCIRKRLSIFRCIGIGIVIGLGLEDRGLEKLQSNQPRATGFDADADADRDADADWDYRQSRNAASGGSASGGAHPG